LRPKKDKDQKDISLTESGFDTTPICFEINQSFSANFFFVSENLFIFAFAYDKEINNSATT